MISFKPDPYIEGYAHLEDCPYDIGTIEYMKWQKGLKDSVYDESFLKKYDCANGIFKLRSNDRVQSLLNAPWKGFIIKIDGHNIHVMQEIDRRGKPFLKPKAFVLKPKQIRVLTEAQPA